MMRPASFIIAVITATAVLSGCQKEHSEPPSKADTTPGQTYPNWPPLLNDFRFNWSAEPGIDITTGPAMVVRAYMEAYDTAWFTLNPDNVFPGFHRATPGRWHGGFAPLFEFGGRNVR